MYGGRKEGSRSPFKKMVVPIKMRRWTSVKTLEFAKLPGDRGSNQPRQPPGKPLREPLDWEVMANLVMELSRLVWNISSVVSKIEVYVEPDIKPTGHGNLRRSIRVPHPDESGRAGNATKRKTLGYGIGTRRGVPVVVNIDNQEPSTVPQRQPSADRNVASVKYQLPSVQAVELLTGARRCLTTVGATDSHAKVLRSFLRPVRMDLWRC